MEIPEIKITTLNKSALLLVLLTAQRDSISPEQAMKQLFNEFSGATANQAA